MTTTARLVACALVLGIAAAADAGWWDDAGAARAATIDEIRKDPDRWRDVVVTTDVRFARLAEPGNPYFTRFTTREWRAVAVFAADASNEKMNSTEPFARIFVRRGSENERRLGDVAKGGRVTLRAVVRDAAKGDPWFEALEVVADGDPLSPEETAVAERAERFLAGDNPAAAESMLRGLLTKRALPRAVQAEFWRKIGETCWSQRRMSDAADAFAASLAAAPNDVATAARFADARKALASSPRSVDEKGAASVAPKPPAPPADFGTPIAVAPSRRLLPPAGLADAPAASPAPTAGPAHAPPPRDAAPPAPLPAPEPTPAVEEAAPLKPKLAGPK